MNRLRYVFGIALVVTVAATSGSARPAAECSKEAWCKVHYRSGRFVDEEVLDGHQYFVYAHTTDERDDKGNIKMHRFRVRCE